MGDQHDGDVRATGDEEEMLRLAASAEAASEHPIGRAVAAKNERRALPAAQREETVQRLVEQEAGLPFDLGHAPLLRATHRPTCPRP